VYPMKIGYLMQAGVADIRRDPHSGPAVHVRHVFQELERLGHHVRLLALLDGGIWKSDDLIDFEPVSVGWIDRFPFRLLERILRRFQYEFRLPYFSFFESVRFAQACCQELVNFDILYERMGWMGFGGGLAARRLKMPLVLEVNGDHLSEMQMQGNAPTGLQYKLSVTLTNWALRMASNEVATGEGWKQKFIERWKISPDKVVVIENGSEIVGLLSREQLRSFIEKDKPQITTIIYVGGFEPWHGITVLIHAFAVAIAKGVSLQLVLVGSGTQQDKVTQLIRNLGIEKNVVLTGSLNEQQMASYLAEADIGVSPYCGRVEYSGLKLLDYKAAGLAIIASGENGQPAIIQHGLNGWIVPPCDEHALSDAIILLVRDVSLRKQLGRQARFDAEIFHCWQHTAKHLEELFLQLNAT
jgi:glycosyltransferase involved in cell wall biosynthesis